MLAANPSPMGASMPKRLPPLHVSAEDAAELRRWIASPNHAQGQALRAKIVLGCSQEVQLKQVAQQLGVQRHTVRLWRERYEQEGLAGLQDRPGRGRKPSIASSKLRKIVEQVGQPPAHLGRWSCRSMAQTVGVSHATVQRMWSANDIKPHVTRTFKLSKDARFVEKFWDIIGLYMDPPDNALVLCCDEKSQCQALERTQPGLPLGVGHIKTRTHDYIRHGTVTLFAALNYLSGKLIAAVKPRHRHQEWLSFLRQIDRETPAGIAIHIIADNYGTHKHDKVKAWLARHPRFHMHFTPTSSSWMNLVERYFRDLTVCLREHSFDSAKQLADCIVDYLAHSNEQPKRYVWRADGAAILEKINRARQKVGMSLLNCETPH
jgi:transposase